MGIDVERYCDTWCVFLYKVKWESLPREERETVLVQVHPEEASLQAGNSAKDVVLA